MATQPVPRYIRKAFQDFGRGLNTKDTAVKLDPSNLQECKNVYINKSSLLETAKGYTVSGSPFPDDADSYIRMLHNYRQGTSIDRLLVAALDEGNANATYKVDLKKTDGDGTYDYIGYVDGTATFTNASTTVTGVGTAFLANLKVGDKIKPDAYGNWYEIQTVTNDTQVILTANYTDATVTGGAYMARIVLNKDHAVRAVTFNDVAVITNGKDSVLAYDGDTLTVITDAPKASYIVKHKSRVFLLGTAANPSTVYWSAVDDETTWDPAAYEPVFEYDNGDITGGASYANSLIVFKNNGGMYQVAGSFDDSAVGTVSFIQKIDTPANTGAIFGETAAIGNDGRLWFLTDAGVYALNRDMSIQPVGLDIKPITDELDTTPGAISNRSYLYTTNAQWDTGTHEATRSVNEDLQPFFDQYTITDAFKASDCVAVKITSDNVVHVVYLSASNRKVIKYCKWDDEGTKTTETALTHTVDIDRLSMDVSANGKVGVMFRDSSTNFSFVERVSGTWSSADAMYAGTWVQFSVKYRTDSVACFAGLATSGAQENLYFGKRATTFPVNLVYSGFGSNNSSAGFNMYLDGSNNPTVSHMNTATTVYASYSGDEGASFSAPAITVSGTAYPWPAGGGVSFPATFIGYNGLGDRIIVAGDNGNIKEVNTTTSTSTNLVATTDRLIGYTLENDRRTLLCISSGGDEKLVYETSYTEGTISVTNGNAVVTGSGTKFLAHASIGDRVKIASQADSVYATILTVDSNTQLTLTAGYGGGTTSGAYILKSNHTVTNTSTATADTTYYPGKDAVSNSSGVFVYALFGASSEEILIRRISPRATWTTPIENDAALTAWSTFTANSTLGGYGIQYEVAVHTASPPTDYNLITSTSVISTAPSKTYLRAKAQFTLSTWAIGSIQSLEFNYFGSGINAKTPRGTFFANDYYCSVTEPGQTANNKMLINDVGGAWSERYAPVSVFCLYKYNLYGGSSTNGDVLLLNDGYMAGSGEYTASIITKEDLLGSLELDKDIYKVYVLYEVKSAGTFTFQYRLDNFRSIVDADWHTATVDMTKDGIAEIPVGDVAKSIQFGVTGQASNGNFGIIGFVVLFGYLNVR